jgi:hypothetical protein
MVSLVCSASALVRRTNFSSGAWLPLYIHP